jgi:four helix bundle protein
MPFKFESLNIWNKALDLSVEVNNIAKFFPKWETFNLCSQIRRASDSVVLNIAEGCTGPTNPEFKRLLNYSIRSGTEVVSCLFIAKRKGYIQQDMFTKF